MVPLVLVLFVMVSCSRAQDFSSLLAQGQEGGLSLEQVVSALRQRGMLDQVDPNLLRRIESRLGTSLINEIEESEETGGSHLAVAHLQATSQHQQQARQRHKNLFGTRPTKRPTRPGRRIENRRNQLSSGGECQALKTENRLLKQQLVKKSQEDQAPTTAIDVLKQLQEQGHFPEEGRSQEAGAAPLEQLLGRSQENSPAPLEQLLAESSNQERGGRLALVDGREISSILITPTPTLSTIFNTVSFVTTVTKNITQLLHLNFAGRRIPTEIVSQSVVVSTSSSVESSTIEITPTPTWQTIVVTPTVTQPPPPPPTPTVDYTALLQKKETERLQLLARIQSLQSQGVRLPPTFGGTRAQVVEIPEKLESFSSLQQYLEQVRQQKAGGEILALPLVALEPSPSLPTTSISTIFMSGSRPGEYSTSLMTITLTPEARARRRREAVEPGTLLVTAAPYINHQVELEGSFLSPSPPLCPSAVTVTVTEQFCQP